ncbi:unnamed protein product [Prunus armeniaca]
MFLYRSASQHAQWRQAKPTTKLCHRRWSQEESCQEETIHLQNHATQAFHMMQSFQASQTRYHKIKLFKQHSHHKNENLEFAAARKGSEQKKPSFVTHEDVIAMLEKKLSQTKRIGSMSLSRRIHHAYSSSHILKATKHQALSFLTEGKGAQRSTSTVSLMPWDHMLHEERVTTTQLNNIRQKHGEDPVDFVHRFRDLVLDCYDEKDEEALVEICISNIMEDYRVYLENIGINQFSRLLEAVRKMSMFVKLNGQEAWKSEEEKVHQTLDEDESFIDYNSCKRKDRETYLPLPFNDEEFHAIPDTMFANGAIKLPKPYKVPTREEKGDPRYCRYHQCVGHSTIACQTLKKIMHARVHDGTLELPSKKQACDEDPLPK